MEGLALCLVCGVGVQVSHAEEIERDMDADNKSCPVCCRTYGEARREELGSVVASFGAISYAADGTEV